MKVTRSSDCREYKSDFANMEVREGWNPRDYQEPVIEFLTTNTKESKLVPLQTGKGKTSIALFSIAKLKQKLAIVILPIYIDKWIQDIVSVHKTTPKDIMVIQGSNALRSMIDMAKNNEDNHDYYIISSRTLQDYITSYENDPEQTIQVYGIEPIELFPILKVGILLVDETHQHFHAIYKILLHSNVKYQIGLSATLMSDNTVVSRVHQVVYPDDKVYKGDTLDKYIDVYPVSYNIDFKHIKKVQTKNYGSNSYSHVAFEKSICRNQYTRQEYMRVIDSCVEDFYVSRYEKNDKLLIFVSTVAFASDLVGYLSNKYRQFEVNRYCEDDPYDNLEDSDIIVSTIISAGTAVDIKNLRTVIQTVSISSPVANIQSLGRLRKLPGKDVRFVYLYCSQIAKHQTYHKKRVELFTNRVANISYKRCRVNIN
jgi:superfamily II DNA or RNA helicase